MIGTPDEVARKLEDFRAAYACTHFIMASQLPGMDPLVATRSLELFAKEVMPGFPPNAPAPVFVIEPEALLNPLANALTRTGWNAIGGEVKHLYPLYFLRHRGR